MKQADVAQFRDEVGKNDVGSDRDGKSVLSDTDSEPGASVCASIAKEMPSPAQLSIAKRHGGGNIGPRATDKITTNEQYLSINEWLYGLGKPYIYS